MSIRRSLFFSLAQRYAGFTISFASTMALARLLTPEEIGIYSVGAAFVGLAQILRDFGVGRYLIQEQELTESHVQSALGVGLVLGVLIAGLLYVLATPVAEFYRADELSQVLHVLALSFLLTPFTTPAMALLARELAFNLRFRVNVLSAFAHAVIGVALAAAGIGPVSLAWASFGSVVISLLALLALRPRVVLRRPSLQHWRRIASFGGRSSLASIIRHFGGQAPDLIMGRLLGMQAVAVYSRAQGLIQVFQLNFLRAVADVAFPAYAQERRIGGNLKSVYLSGVSYITVLAWPFFGLLYLLAEPLILLLFGDQWLQSVPLVRILCIAGAVAAPCFLVTDLMLSLGLVQKYTRLICTTEIVRVGAILSVMLTYPSLQLVAWTQVAVSGLTLFLSISFLKRELGIFLLEVARTCFPSFVASAATFGACAMFLHLNPLPQNGLTPLAAGVVAALVHSLAIFVTKHPIRNEARHLWMNIRSRLAAFPLA